MIAYLTDGERTLFSKAEPRAGEPTSAVVKLVQGLYDFDPEFARRIARQRIFSTSPLTPMCYGMIKVAAHRSTENAPLPELKSDWLKIEPLPAPALECPISSKPPMMIAEELARQVPRSGERFELSRAIGAVLTTVSGEILAAAVNTNAKNKTRHAEVNLIQGFYSRHQRPIPRGAKLFTTLKPCRMCAGMLWQAAEAPETLKVFYAQFDDGPNARETILNARSHDRRRFAPALLDLELEQKHSSIT